MVIRLLSTKLEAGKVSKAPEGIAFMLLKSSLDLNGHREMLKCELLVIYVMITK